MSVTRSGAAHAAHAALAGVALVVVAACSGPAGSRGPIPRASLPPVSGPPVSGPPVSGPPVSGPPVSGPPVPSALEAPGPSTLPAPATGVSWLHVSPPQGTPGSRVALDVACLDELGPVSSPELDVGPLAPDPQGHQPWHLSGAATVRPGTAPGRYPISAACGNQRLSATFTVVAGR